MYAELTFKYNSKINVIRTMGYYSFFGQDKMVMNDGFIEFYRKYS